MALLDSGNLTATIVAVTVSAVLVILGVLLAVFLWRRRTTTPAQQVTEQVRQVVAIPACS